MIKLKKQDFADMFACSARLMAQSTTLLSEIDSRFGDGDHGVTIGKITKVIEAKLPALDTMALKDLPVL